MGKMDANMQMVAICQEFHWTFQDYTAQPSWFITLIKEKIKRDNKEQELQLKKAKRG